MSEHVVVLTTAGSDDQADELARALVERRLAACVSIVNDVCSVYRWKDELARESEKLLLIKTSRAVFPRLREALRELHTYEVPEIVALPVLDGDADYLGWLDGQLESGD